MAAAQEPPATENEPGFDQVLAQLRSIVERLEGGNLSLEQSLAAFEEGVKLSRSGARILDRAEQRVEILMRDENGAEQAVAFGDLGGGGGGGEPDRGHR